MEYTHCKFVLIGETAMTHGFHSPTAALLISALFIQVGELSMVKVTHSVPYYLVKVTHSVP